MNITNLATIVGAFVVFIGGTNAAAAAEELQFDDEMTRINYSLGYQIGGDFKSQDIEMNADAIMQGIRDALSQEKPQMTPQEMNSTLVALKRKVTDNQRAKRRAGELSLIEDGKIFMAENAKQPGIVVSDSGLQYRIIDAGSGKRPQAADEITVNYKGMRIDGVMFDSGESVKFRMNGTIKGWTEGLQLIREGGKIELFVPPNIAYRDRGPMAHRTLVFEVELLSVSNSESNSETS